MADLRGEIVETQKIRADIVKWKLIVCAALGGAAAGLVGVSPLLNAFIILALLPPACVYCDAECYHLNLRIIVIGTYLKMDKRADQFNYERFAAACHASEAFGLEHGILTTLTEIICGISAVFGMVLFFAAKPLLLFVLNDQGYRAARHEPQVGVVFFLSGAACYYFSLKIQSIYKKRCKAIEENAKHFRLSSNPMPL